VGAIRPKLTIGRPNDKYEQEADRVADEVMEKPDSIVLRQPLEEEEELLQTKSMIQAITPVVMRQTENEEEEEELLQSKPLGSRLSPIIQRQPEDEEEEIQTKLKDGGTAFVQRQTEGEEEEELLQTKSAGGQKRTAANDLAARIQSLRGGGRPLSKSERTFFEPHFGYDFSNVRIHADDRAAETARDINANAFTHGPHIIFGAGQYAPDSGQGRHLLAHELSHVVQQQAASQPSQIRRRVVDTNRFVTCRNTRSKAADTLRNAETKAVSILQSAAYLIYLFLYFYENYGRLISAGTMAEPTFLRDFRNLVWRRFRLDIKRPGARRFLRRLQNRFTRTARSITGETHRYICGAPGREPAGTCTTKRNQGIAWTATGIKKVELCDYFWGQTDDDKAETILHERFHYLYGALGDCEKPNRLNTICYEMFAAELAGTATSTDYATCCAPPAAALPAFSAPIRRRRRRRRAR
jgi:hypothetical protein